MCGIAGIVNLHSHTRHEQAIKRMTDRIAHRGPDAEGVYVDGDIALGHRRLSIIDLSEASNQPMWDVTGRYVIIYNGEIYNYLEVKARLPEYPFRTASDSEVALAAFIRWGIRSISELNGMFAFAIWDTKEKELFITRDRLGKKPFYYYLDDHHFVFGSEVRSLLESGLVPRQLEDQNLREFLTYQSAIGDHTMVKGVKSLRAGHFAWIRKSTLTETPYWSYAVSPSEDDVPTARKKIKDLLIDAVRLRMIADVPLGAFLSGGIDSSLIVACMAELSELPVNTFTISFNEKQFDESDFAQQIASTYHTHHHRILLSPNVFLDSMEDILSAMDTPSGDGPNTYIVSKHTREAGIKVALSGLGGDELFVGYNKFLMFHRLMTHRWMMTVPYGIRHIAAKIATQFGSGQKMEKIGQFLNLRQWDMASIYPVLRSAYSHNEVSELLRSVSKGDSVVDRLTQTEREIAHLGTFSHCTVGEMETYTRDVLLRDTDQMSMAHALEVRVPFFDYRLFKYVLSLPDGMKYPHTPKKLLVDAMAPRLPDAISQRSKMGFSLPWKHWLRNELAPMADQRIQCLADRPEFNGAEVLRKWNAFRKGDDRILWSRIWKLVVLSDWLQRNKL